MVTVNTNAKEYKLQVQVVLQTGKMHDEKKNVKRYLLCGIFYVNLQFNKNIVLNNPKPVGT